MQQIALYLKLLPTGVISIIVKPLDWQLGHFGIFIPPISYLKGLSVRAAFAALLDYGVGGVGVDFFGGFSTWEAVSQAA